MKSLHNTGGSSSSDEEDKMLTIQLGGLNIVPHAVETAIDLDLFEIMAKATPLGTHLSPLDLASTAAPKNPDAPMMIDRLLRFLVAYSVCTCKLVKDEAGRESRAYGLGRIGKNLLKDEDGFSLAPYVLPKTLKAKGGVWSYFTESIQEGGASALERARGALVFEYMKGNENAKKSFTEAMMNHTSIVMKKILQNYHGLEGISDLVDVGGCLGGNLALIVSKYPHIKALNFDLPHMVKLAPKIIGVEHIGGDMFDEVPRGQAIMMKFILHDWSDEQCVEILKNCKKAIPEDGKVIVIEMIVPEEVSDTDVTTKNTLCLDLKMMSFTRGGKERTKEEFEDLAMKAGFKVPKIIYGAYSYWILEFYPN